MELNSGRISWRELGKGTPLVLLHGWSMSHAVFTELADLLCDKYRIFIPDLPGHAGSNFVDPCSLGNMALSLGQWLTQLHLPKISLLGWSLGGQVALQVAAQMPHQISRLVLVATTPKFCAGNDWDAGLAVGELRALKRGLQRRYLGTMGDFFDLQFKDEEFPSDRRLEILNFAVRPIGLPDPESAIATLEILRHEDLRPVLSEIGLETLIIHGELDRIIPHAAGVYLSENLLHAQLVTLERVGHAPFLSRPQQVSQLLKGFCG